MKNLIDRLCRLMRDDSGQDLLEYGLLAALIALVAIVAVTNSGNAPSVHPLLAISLPRESGTRRSFTVVDMNTSICELKFSDHGDPGRVFHNFHDHS